MAINFNFFNEAFDPYLISRVQFSNFTDFATILYKKGRFSRISAHLLWFYGILDGELCIFYTGQQM